MHDYYVCIMSNPKRSVLYIGVTGNLERRVAEHKTHALPGFTAKYNAVDLVYCEQHGQIEDAISREKQLKGWSRKKKDALVETQNPEWKDLAAE